MIKDLVPSLGFLSSPENRSYNVDEMNFRVVSIFNGSFFSKISMQLYRNGIMIRRLSQEFQYPTGGEIKIDGEWRTHKFIQVGTSSFNIPISLNSTAEFLVVGGGGGGGFNFWYCGGGGGGGGFILGNLPLNHGIIPVNVGKGGKGSSRKNSAGEKGGNSYLGEVIAYGGGGGGSGMMNVDTNEVVSPTSGASGGGGGAQFKLRTRNGAAGVSGQGHSGGNGYGYDTNCVYQGAGGGGGAGSEGMNAISSKAGNGGEGKEYLGANFSAGGGGGKRCSGGLGPGLGGSRVGGNGGWRNKGGDAVQSSGSGGGGAAGGEDTSVGGNGASGIIIIRYNSTQSFSLIEDYDNLSTGSYTIVLLADMLSMQTYSFSLNFEVVSHTQTSSVSFKNPIFCTICYIFLI